MMPNTESDEQQVNYSPLVRKVDFRLLPYLCLLYLLSFLDRVNLGNVRLYGLEAKLNLTTKEFSWALSIFFLGYVLFEVPSNLMLTRVKPPVWIARIMITWGIITMSMAAVHNSQGLIASRFFLGVAEAGLVPGIVFYLTRWYTRREQASRIGFFFTASSLAGAFSGLLCYAISNIDGVGNLQGWQWIFIIEGAPTVLVGILTYWILPASPSSVTWLTESEKQTLISKTVSETRETGFDKEQFLKVLKNYRVYLHMIFYLCYCIPFYALALLMPSIIFGLGFDKVNSMLMTVPPYVLAFFYTMGVAIHSDRRMDRSSHVILSAFTSLLGFILLLTVPPTYMIIRYLSICLGIMGATACIAPALAWSNNNFIGTTASATSGAMIIASGNLGGAIAGQLYSPSEAPYYYRSHLINIICLTITILTSLLLRRIYYRANQQLEFQATTTDITEKSDKAAEVDPNFRYIL